MSKTNRLSDSKKALSSCAKTIDSSLEKNGLQNLPRQLSLDFDSDDIEEIKRRCQPILQSYMELLSIEILNDEQSDLLSGIVSLAEEVPFLSNLLEQVESDIVVIDNVSRQFNIQARAMLGEEFEAWVDRQ